MKKEKKRELTIKQLEKRKNIANKISNYFIIVAIAIILVLATISIITGITLPEYVTMKIISLSVIGIMVIYGIILKFANKYQREIESKNRQEQINKLNQLTCNGNIKEKAIIKDEVLKNAILSNNIDRVVFTEINCEDKYEVPKHSDFIVMQIYLKDNSCIQAFISIKDLLKIITESTKKQILNSIIRSIQINDSEVEIETNGFTYKERITDDELIEMFELKE